MLVAVQKAVSLGLRGRVPSASTNVAALAKASGLPVMQQVASNNGSSSCCFSESPRFYQQYRGYSSSIRLNSSVEPEAEAEEVDMSLSSEYSSEVSFLECTMFFLICTHQHTCMFSRFSF